jgi:hypothetical protein
MKDDRVAQVGTPLRGVRCRPAGAPDDVPAERACEAALTAMDGA